jgi:hypothetical protein
MPALQLQYLVLQLRIITATKHSFPALQLPIITPANHYSAQLACITATHNCSCQQYSYLALQLPRNKPAQHKRCPAFVAHLYSCPALQLPSIKAVSMLKLPRIAQYYCTSGNFVTTAQHYNRMRQHLQTRTVFTTVRLNLQPEDI